MKTKPILLAVFLMIFFLPVLVFGQTNAPSAIPATFNPILELLGGKGTFVTTFITWTAAISAVLAPFAVFMRNKLADAINRAADSADGDDDVYLRRLFENKLYRITAFILNFANVRLPTLPELERAIALQREAVRESIQTPNQPKGTS